MNIGRRNFIKGMPALGADGLMMTSAQREAFARTGARSQSIINVKEFGAKGDGETHDSKAIQDALDAAGMVQGTVYFPSGKYLCHDLKVHQHTTLLADPVWRFSPAQKGAVLVLDSDEADCVLNITGAFGVHLHGLQIKGNPKAEKLIHGIFLNNATEFSKKEDSIVVDDCKVQHFSGHGLYLLRIWLFIVRHSHFYRNNGSGIAVVGWDGFVTDNQLSGNGQHGFGAEKGASTIMFTANRVEWNKGYGMYINGGDAWDITGNCFDRNGGAGIYLAGMRTTAVSGNVIRRCGKDSSMLGEGIDYSTQMIFDGCRGISVVCNSAAAGKDDRGKGVVTPNYGMTLANLEYCSITSNTFYKGYLKDMILDRGGHGKEFVLKNNVGSSYSGK